MKLAAIGLNQIVELAGCGPQGGVGGGAGVGLNVPGIFGGEEDDAGWVHHQRCLEHEVSERGGLTEIGAGQCGPALAEWLIFAESVMQVVEVVGEGTMVNAERL